MSLNSRFTLVGVRADGSRSVLASQAVRDAVENVLKQIGPDSGFSRFQVTLDGDWPPRLKQPPQRAV
jgi:hypothetical protein